MGKKRKNKAPEKLVISKEDMWNIQKPRYNGFACGYGVHGKTKYDRRKDKQFLKDEVDSFNN